MTLVEPPAETKPTRWWRRKIVTIPARIGLSLTLIVIIFAQMDDIDTDRLIPSWNQSNTFWTLAAFAMMFLAYVLGAFRWQRVLHALGTHVPLPRLFSHYMAGQFLSNFFPTTVGGDVLRISRLSRDTDDGPLSFTSVVFERLSGWLVLPVITFLGFAVNPGLTGLGSATSIPLYVAIVTLAALVVVILVVGSDWIGDSLEGRTGLLRFAEAVHLGIDRFREHPRAAGEVVASAFVYQFVLLFAAGCAVEALEINEVGITALMAFLPAVLIVQVLPLGIGGLGIREGALVVFLGGLGVADEQAVALGLAMYMLTLITSFIGFPALILGGRGREDAIDTDSILEPS
ncbi:MAG: lysylphosphatidylglycerol synthase transmembrane domain-containing protein [Acidimicrobiales bacterium]